MQVGLVVHRNLLTQKNVLSFIISRKIPQLPLLFLKIIVACKSLKNGLGLGNCPAVIHGESWRGILMGVSVEKDVRSFHIKVF